MRLPLGRAELLVRDPLQPREKIDLGRIGFREGGHVGAVRIAKRRRPPAPRPVLDVPREMVKSEEHTSELQSLMRISYAVFCLKKKTTAKKNIQNIKVRA